MPYIHHPARQGENVSIADWLRYHIGGWLSQWGYYLEDRALYPANRRCKECGGVHSTDYECDGIPF